MYSIKLQMYLKFCICDTKQNFILKKQIYRRSYFYIFCKILQVYFDIHQKILFKKYFIAYMYLQCFISFKQIYSNGFFTLQYISAHSRYDNEIIFVCLFQFLLFLYTYIYCCVISVSVLSSKIRRSNPGISFSSINSMEMW